MFRWAFVGMLLGGSLSSSQGLGAAQGLSLRELMLKAEQQAPTLELARRELTMKRLELSNAEAAYYPTLDLKSQLAVGWPLEEAKGLNRVGLALNETLFDNGKSSSQLNLAQSELRLAELEYREKRDKLAYELAQSFYELQMYREFSANLAENVRLLGKQYKMIESAYHQGLKQQRDYSRVKVDYQQIQLSTKANERAIANQCDKIKNLIGEGLASQLAIAHAPLDRLPLHKNSVASLEGLLTVEKSQLQKAIEIESLAMARKADAPEIALTAFAGYDRPVFAGVFANPDRSALPGFTSNVTLSFTYALWDGGRRQRNVAIALEKEQAARIKDSENRATSELEVRALERQMANLSADLAMQRDILANSKTSFDLLEENYRKGLSSYLDLILAYKDLSSIKEGLVRSQFELLNGYDKLLSYQGQLYDTLIH